MLRIIVPGDDFFDESTQEFVTVGDVALDLEHSLVALSKWESEFEKPFLSKEDKTTEETVAYIKFMNLTPEIPPEVFSKLSEANFIQVNNYIEAKMTATWFNEIKKAPQTSEVITSELIYYWMTSFKIPFECQHWHVNRLFTLIRICSVKNTPPKKMGRAERAQQNRELNEQRKRDWNTKG